MSNNITIAVDRWRAGVGLMAALIAVAASAWGATSWAIRHQVNEAVVEQTRSAGYVVVNDLENVRQLQELRLSAIERQLAKIESDVSFLVRQQMQRSQP